MTPYKHAESSAKKFGGEPNEYLYVHNWFDETKAFTGDWTHRALRHHSAGIEWCCSILGHEILIDLDDDDKVGDNHFRIVPTKLVAEQHVMEDCGFIPTPQDWLRGIKQQPADWMLKVGYKTKKEIEIL